MREKVGLAQSILDLNFVSQIQGNQITQQERKLLKKNQQNRRNLTNYEFSELAPLRVIKKKSDGHLVQGALVSQINQPQF